MRVRRSYATYNGTVTTTGNDLYSLRDTALLAGANPERALRAVADPKPSGGFANLTGYTDQDLIIQVDHDSNIHVDDIQIRVPVPGQFYFFRLEVARNFRNAFIKGKSATANVSLTWNVQVQQVGSQV